MTKILISIFLDYNDIVKSTQENTVLIEKLQLTTCSDNCEIGTITSQIKLDLNSFPSGCEVDKCG
jgi:hypothetical protein